MLKNKLSYILYLLICACFYGGETIAQFVTTEELNIQRLFIEAQQEKLLGSNENAARMFSEVLKRDPANDAAAYELSRVYYSMEDYDQSLMKINTALRIDPSNEWYYIMKGDILEKQGELQQAAEVYLHLTKLNPRRPYYFEHLTGLYRKTGDMQKALVTLENFEKIGGITEEIIKAKFNILNDQGKTDDAIAELEKLVTTYPHNTEYMHLIASFCKQSGEVEQANKYYRKIIDIDPNDARANLALANTYKSDGADVSYLRSIQPLMSNKAIDLDVKVQELIPFVEKFAREDDPYLGDVLDELITTLVDQYPREAKVHAIYADLLSLKDLKEEARQEYEKTLALDQSVFDVWEQLMYLEVELEDFDALISTAENAMDYFPNQASVYYFAGLGYKEKNNASESLTHLEQALIMTGKKQALKVKVLVTLGMVYQQIGSFEKSKEAFEKALDINPDAVFIKIQYSIALSTRGAELDKAKSLALSVLEHDPENPFAEHALALAFFQSREYGIAKTWIDKSLSNGGENNPQILDLAGDISFFNNQIDQAVEYWQSAENKGLQTDQLRRKIVERRIVH
jgi:tetratricopeptide (TPR) repeat protein